MRKYLVGLGVVLASLAFTGCTRIETGTVGVRVGFDKQISTTELPPGSFNQTLIGEVLTFPVKDVSVTLDDMTPVAKDNSTMKDVDMVVTYSINQSQVSELFSNKNKSFHLAHGGDIYLMYNYVIQNSRNALYKVARTYDALDMADNRETMEISIREMIQASLVDEKIEGALIINQVMIRNVVPADTVVASSNELVRAKNELKRKEIEVKTAHAEAERMNALTSQSGQSIAYMQAQALQTLAEAVKAGSVSSIIVPFDFRGIVNVPAPAPAKSKQ